MDEDIAELVARLSTAAGMIMEDASAAAILGGRSMSDAELAELELGARDAALLIQAARVLARRQH